MNKKGFVHVFCLLITASLMALSVSALTMTRWQSAAAQARLMEARAVLVAQAMAQAAVRSNFLQPNASVGFKNGHADMERLCLDPEENSAIRVVVHEGPVEKKIEVEWKRSGEQWEAESWREN